MGLVTSILNLIANTGTRTAQDAPFGTSTKTNVALAGLLSNDVALDARLAAIEAAVAGPAAPIGGVPMPTAPEGIVSAGANPWSTATLIANVATASYTVSPTSGNGAAGAFACYVPLSGVVTFGGRPTKLFLAVYSSIYNGTTAQVVAVGNNGAINLGAVFSVSGTSFTYTNGLTFWCWEQVGQWQVLARAFTTADTLVTINPTTLAGTTQSMSRPGAINYPSQTVNNRLATRAYPVGNNSSLAATLLNWSTTLYNGWFALMLMTRGASQEYMLFPIDYNDTSAYSAGTTMAGIGGCPVLESLGNGLFVLFCTGAPTTGGAVGELTLLRADDSGIRILTRVTTPFGNNFGIVRAIGSTIHVTANMTISGAARRVYAAFSLSGDGVTTPYALTQVAPSSGYFQTTTAVGTTSPNASLNLLGTLFYDARNLVHVTCDAGTGPGNATNAVGLHRLTIDPVAGTVTEQAGVSITFGADYDTSAFQPAAAVQAWPDILLLGGACGQSASTSTNNGKGVHSTFQLS